MLRSQKKIILSKSPIVTFKNINLNLWNLSFGPKTLGLSAPSQVSTLECFGQIGPNKGHIHST